jgi:hypothetical protein
LSSALAPSNYLLRDRVARALGPIVKYKEGEKSGQLVGPDVEAWFRQDCFRGEPHLVAQWADAHNALAQAWVKADPGNAAAVDAWAKEHADAAAEWVKANPATPEPAATDLAVLFFDDWSATKPGTVAVAGGAPGTGRDDGEDRRTGAGRDGDPVSLLRDVARGQSGGRPGRCPCRSRDHLSRASRPSAARSTRTALPNTMTVVAGNRSGPYHPTVSTTVPARTTNYPLQPTPPTPSPRERSTGAAQVRF